MDAVTYALLKKRIEGIEPGFTYKGSVAAVADLPSGADKGDMYTVTGDGNARYVWDGSAWKKLEAGTEEELATLEVIEDLIHDEIPDTTQTIEFDSSGNVQSITHSRNSTTVRTDAFAFETDTITEVRTLSSGETLTIVTNTDTLTTTVTFAAA